MMAKSRKIIIFTISGFIGILILLAVALLLFVDANAYKNRLEVTASQVLGMEVRVNGRLGINFFPGLLVTLEDVHIRNHGADIVSTKEGKLEIDFLPLLHREIRIVKITLKHPRIFINRAMDGSFNFEKPGTPPALHLPRISLSQTTILYADKQSGGGFEAKNCNLEVRRLQIASGENPDLLKDLSLTAELACGETRAKNFTVSDVKVSINGRDGVFDLKPVAMRLFDGEGLGTIQADFTNLVPLFHVSCSLSRFHLKEFFKTLPADKGVEGTMDFVANLSMQGKSEHAIRQSMTGKISLRGENIIINGSDLDRDFSRFESSQNFNLVDVGAFMFAGPLGLVVTKGYNFASIFQGSGGRSEIKSLVSDWTVERGVARARDVAMATHQHRIALQGTLDFINEQFNDMTVALVDEQGCATVRQKIHGPFQKPVVEEPSILKSLTGPVRSLLKQGMALFPFGECEVFYAGSMAPPQ